MSDAEADAQDQVFQSLSADFFDESDQLLHRLNEKLLRLEEWVRAPDERKRSSGRTDLLNELFRAAHSLTKLSLPLGLSQITTISDQLESVFEATRRDELPVTPSAIELVSQSLDCLGALVERLKERRREPVPCEEVLRSIGDLLADAESSSRDEVKLSKASARKSNTKTVADEPPEVIDHFAEIVDETAVPAKYLSIFIDETDLALDQLTESMLTIETRQGGGTTEELLIIFHRIKGSAAAVGLNRPAKLAHLVEDILQTLRDEVREPSPELVDAMLNTTDALRTYVDGLKTSSPCSERFNELCHQLLETHDSAGHTSGDSSKTTAAASKVMAARPAEKKAPAGSPTAVQLTDEQSAQIKSSAPQGSAGFVGQVLFIPEFPLVGLKARLVHEKLSRLGDVFYCDPPAERLEELEELTQLFFGVTTDQPEGIVRQQLRLGGIKDAHLRAFGQDAPASASNEPKPGTSDRHPPGTPAKERSGAVARRSAPATLSAPTAGGQDVAPSDSKGARVNETLRVDIERLDQLMSLAGQLVITKSRLVKIGQGLKGMALDKHTMHVLSNISDTLRRIPQSAERVDSRHRSTELESIVTQVRRLQSDLDMVNEAVHRSVESRGWLNELFEAVHQLDRVTDGIQKSVMDTRMVPIGPLFGRFRRVVRDITRTYDKEISLVIRGEKTELDKRMIDELGDPLIHMVRNSADHGIESAADRQRAGKPRVGTVTLDAFHRGNTIIIQVSDDGRGIDAGRIRAKAIEKGLITPADAEALSDHQILQLIWEPGLTTAEKVTEISGRGMGMDIVRSKIEELNGAVELDSELGRGTTFTIKLPLTLAILPSLMAEIDGEVLALPVEAVVEIVRVTPNEMHTLHGQRTARVRGRVVSVVDLSDVFTWAQHSALQKDRSSEVTLVIVGSDGQELALAVDRLLGEEDIVIKSLAENFRNVHGIAGASILGDGRVSLILDVAALIEISSRRPSAVAAC